MGAADDIDLVLVIFLMVQLAGGQNDDSFRRHGSPGHGGMDVHGRQIVQVFAGGEHMNAPSRFIFCCTEINIFRPFETARILILGPLTLLIRRPQTKVSKA